MNLSPGGLKLSAAMLLVGCGSDQTGLGTGGGPTFGNTGSTSQGAGGGPQHESVAATGVETMADYNSVCVTQTERQEFSIPVSRQRSFAGVQAARHLLLAPPEDGLPKPLAQPSPVPRDLLQVEHFLAYYAPPTSQALLSASLELLPEPTLALFYAMPESQRLPLQLVVLLDRSQSAGAIVPAQLGALQDLLVGLARHPQAGDSLVVYGWAGETKLLAQSADEAAQLTVDRVPLEVGGDLEAALEVALSVERAPGAFKHTWLFTDGGANAHNSIVTMLETKREPDAALSVAQFAKAVSPTNPLPLTPANTDLLRKVSDAGEGGQHYLVSPEDSRRLFDTRFGTTVASVGPAALGISLPPELVPLLPDAVAADQAHPMWAGAVVTSLLPVQLACNDFVGALSTSDLRLALKGPQGAPTPVAILPVDLLSRDTPYARETSAIVAVVRALRQNTGTECWTAKQLVWDALVGAECQGDPSQQNCVGLFELRAMLQAAFPNDPACPDAG